MPIRATCPCGKVYHYKDAFAGRQAKCPACGAVVNIHGQRVIDAAPGAPPASVLTPGLKKALYASLGLCALVLAAGMVWHFVIAAPAPPAKAPAQNSSVSTAPAATSSVAKPAEVKADQPGAAPSPVPAAPSPNTATPANKPRITLGELRKRPKLGDFPYGGMGGYLKRMQTFGSTEVAGAWQKGFAQLGINLVAFEIARDPGFEQRLRGLFDDKNNLKADLMQHYLKRLPTIPRKEFDTWFETLVAATGGEGMPSQNTWSIAYTLVAADPLYDTSDAYVPQKGQRYLARLKDVKPQNVRSFLKAYSNQSYSDQVAVSLIMVEEFFQGDRFDEKLFQEVMAESPARNAPQKLDQ